ncbi:MAG: 6-phosphofructokinase [Candidatus Xenobiia bacterium LiM19]
MAEKVEFNPTDKKVTDFLKQCKFFVTITDEELSRLAPRLTLKKYHKGEMLYSEGDTAECCYIVEHGRFSLELFGHVTKVFERGDVFGELPYFDRNLRSGTVNALEEGTLYCMPYELFSSKEVFSADTLLTLFHHSAEVIAAFIRQADELFNYMDVLLIEDGGCAPGKNPIVAFLAEYLEKAGRQVFITAEGYRSLVSGKDTDFRCLIYDPKVYERLDYIPGVVFVPPLKDDRGAEFRSERFPEFSSEEIQKKAAETVVKRHVKAIVGIGGNGTFGGLNALCRHLPEHIQVFHVPVTIDSDVHGTECIGQHTGVEVGAEKIRCYLADARTHHRCYIIEMMGRLGGFHALNSCLGAGAHLAVLPSSNYDLRKINQALKEKESAVIVVAEGYKKDERDQKGYKGNAAEFFRDELMEAGYDAKMKIVCEPFSRDIRGASPNNLDIALTQRFARKVAHLMNEGKSRLMPAIQSSREYEIPFDDVKTDNTKGAQFASLANRLFKQ